MRVTRPAKPTMLRTVPAASLKAMLLSFERPIAGASVFPTPGAMLRHFIGLVPAVLPESPEHVQTDNWDSPGTWEVLSFPQ
jgi:hypothetical protein